MNNNINLKPRSQWDTSMLPNNVEIGKNNLPCVKTRLYGYGKRFNAFCTKNANHYHTSRCPNFRFSKNKKILHRYEAINNNLLPCKECHPKPYIDSWYDEFLEVNSQKPVHLKTDINIPEPTRRQSASERNAASIELKKEIQRQIDKKNATEKTGIKTPAPCPEILNEESPQYIHGNSGEQKFKNLFVITLIILIIVILLFGFSEYKNKKETDKYVSEIKSFKSIISEQESLKSQNEDLKAQLKETRTKRDELFAKKVN